MYYQIKRTTLGIKKCTTQKPFRYIVATLLIVGAFILSIGKILAETPSSVFFEPGTSALSTNQTLSLKINSGSIPVGFVRVSFAFDNTKINLANEITPTLPFDTVIEKTTMSDANTFGAARLVLAVPPVRTNQAPSGTFEIAQIPVHVVSRKTNDATVFIFNKEDIQIIDMQNNPLAVDIVNPAYTLNYTGTSSTNTPTTPPEPTSTPTSSPTVTPTPLLTSTETQTISPSDIPSSTVTATITSTVTVSSTPSITPIPTLSLSGGRSSWFSHFWGNFRQRFSSSFRRH